MEIETLRQHVRYNPETGILHRVRPARNSPAGPVGGKTPTGHMRVMICSKRLLVHRVAFALMVGRWPQGEIDHIDGDPTNNKWENLRDVSRKENLKNKSRPADNTSGVIGVSWIKSRHKWRARISVDGDYKFLGAFDDFNDAVKARLAAERKFGFHENHGRETRMNEIKEDAA